MNEYKQFFIKTLIILLVSLIVIPAIIITIGYFLIGEHVYAKGAAHINYWIETKNNRAEELNKKGNKIVFLSGSNTLYGFNSKYASKVTGLPVLNYGIHVDFGTYMLEKVKSILKDGDIVILPLEFNYYAEDSDEALPGPFADYIISYDKSYYKQTSLIRKLGLVFYLAQTFISHPNVPFEKELIDKSYYSQLNDYGDYVGNLEPTDKILNYGATVTITENIPEKYNKFELYKFIQYCKVHDIALYATMPTMWHPDSPTQDEIDAFNKIKSFYTSQGIPMIGEVDSGMLKDKNLFYDTNYHTNVEGTKIRTDWFIKNILSLDEIKNGIVYEK